MFRDTLKGTSINNIPEKPLKSFGEDVRIVEICEHCPYEKCIENTTRLCPRFKQERDKILKGNRKRQNRIQKKKKKGEK
jgi:hypothetical protein